MSTSKIIKELLIGCIVIAPLMYLCYLWSSLPAEVPVHFDAQGMPNNYGSKSYVALTLLLLSAGTYLFMLYLPKIDPKKNFSIFNKTFVNLRFIIALFFSAIGFIILFSVKEGELNTKLFYIAFAVLLVLMGNYMSNIRPNYFLGIRTPWALESEANWKKTHLITGRLWFASGILLVVLMLMLPQSCRGYVFFGVILLNALFPRLFSYYQYRKEKRSKENTMDNKNQNSKDWLGFIYFNRKDSRVIVPKRIAGLGWTLNFGSWYTYIIIGILVAVFILARQIK